MTIAIAAQTQTPAPKTARRGFSKLPCLKCGETCVNLFLNDLSHESAFTCGECEGEWSLDEARAAVEQWTQFLKWANTAPEMADDE
jgi:hypothetical protein